MFISQINPQLMMQLKAKTNSFLSGLYSIQMVMYKSIVPTI
jgi:hypothetical protein